MNEYVSKTFVSTQLFKVIIDNIHKWKNHNSRNSEKIEKSSIITSNNISSDLCKSIMKETKIILDIKSLQEYSSNDFSFEKEFLNLFMKEFEEYIKSLKFALIERSSEKINFIIHKMKSPLLILNLNNIVEKITVLKNISASLDNQHRSFELYKSLKDDFKKLKMSICNYIDHNTL